MAQSRLAPLLVMAALLAAPARAEPAGERYRNEKYGLSFALPPDAGVCRSVAPQPDHGLLFRPRGVRSPPCSGDIEAGARYTSVDAHFDVDGSVTAANFVRVECPQFAYDSEGTVTAISPPAIPAGRLDWVDCRIDGAGGSIEEVLFARRDATTGVPRIAYTITLKTTPRHYRADRAAFVAWLRTIRLTDPAR